MHSTSGTLTIVDSRLSSNTLCGVLVDGKPGRFGVGRRTPSVKDRLPNLPKKCVSKYVFSWSLGLEFVHSPTLRFTSCMLGLCDDPGHALR